MRQHNFTTSKGSMMARVPLPRGKGEPPFPATTIGNLDKPEPGDLAALNFKVPRAFRREFRRFAANRDKKMNGILIAAFGALKSESAE